MTICCPEACKAESLQKKYEGKKSRRSDLHGVWYGRSSGSPEPHPMPYAELAFSPPRKKNKGDGAMDTRFLDACTLTSLPPYSLIGSCMHAIGPRFL